MQVNIIKTDVPVDVEIQRNKYALRAVSLSGRHWEDTSELFFDEAELPMLLECLAVLDYVTRAYDGYIEDHHWDELYAQFSKAAVEVVTDNVIGGDMYTDGEQLATLIVPR